MAAQTLVPNLDLYLKQRQNILLYGPHGVGKTEVLRTAIQDMGLKMKYFSCSTLDPFTDLVGIPYPIDDPQRPGHKTLMMVRPREIDEANIIMFDEINRAQDTKTLNAILEIVQFRSINGEVLPNLMGVVAAMNPPDDSNYQVHDLDPALIDRFDVFHEVKPKVDVAYLTSVGIDKKIAQAFQAWWTEGQKGKAAYVSPRRVEKMARMVATTQNPSIVKAMLPPGDKHDHGKLIANLNQVLYTPAPTPTNPLSGGEDPNIDYSRNGFVNNPHSVAARVADPAVSIATLRKIVDVMDGIGAQTLAYNVHPIVEALPPHMVESMINGWNTTKRAAFKREWEDSFQNGGPTIQEPWVGLQKVTTKQGKHLTGKTFCATGALNNHSRDSIRATVRQHGGIFSANVTNSVDYLIMGSKPGDTKVDAARSKGIPALNIQQFNDACITGRFISTDVDSCVP